MNKPGRNDPCYCGSGKKYKKCHMEADKAADAERRELSNAGQWLRRDFMKFARDERFAEPFAVALPTYWNGLYNVENAEQMGQNEALRFFDWLVFDYRHGDQPRLIDVYRTERYVDLSIYQRRILDSWVEAPPAVAFELTGYDGQILHLRDFVTGETYDVYEPAGHGPVNEGDLLLGRLVPVQDQLEFSTIAAYLPQEEIGDLSEKLTLAREVDAAEHADASYEDFMRRRGYLIIHHALEQAEEQGRPPVAAENADRADKLVRKAAKRLRTLKRA